jgi:hypothetical protein
MPISGIESITRDVWTLWWVSLLANLVVVLFFLSGFLRRPRLLVSGSSIAVLLLLVAWKALAIATDVNSASRCGEARDFEYPVVWAWAGNEFVFFFVFASWLTMAIVAIAALINHGIDAGVKLQKTTSSAAD